MSGCGADGGGSKAVDVEDCRGRGPSVQSQSQAPSVDVLLYALDIGRALEEPDEGPLVVLDFGSELDSTTSRSLHGGVRNEFDADLGSATAGRLSAR